MESKRRVMIFERTMAVIAAVVVALLGWFVGGIGLYETRVSFLAVGQGDCSVIQHRGATILIDTGPSEGTAKWTIIPKLRELGVARINGIFLSHPDSDHTAGLDAILRRYRDTPVYVSSEFKNHPELKAQFKRMNVNPIWLPRQGRGSLGEMQFEFLNPPFRDDDNDASTIMRFHIGKAAVQFSGDASGEVEESVAAQGEWKAQILKAGHHGSRNSTSFTWLREVQPEYVIVSCGTNNNYGHPHGEVLARVKATGGRILRTDQAGPIQFTLNGDRFEQK